MVFSSLFFLYIFLPLNLILYYCLPGRTIKNWILIVFSLLFYAWGEPIWVLLLIISAFVDYVNALFIDHFKGKPIAKLGVYSTLVFNLGVLITFKYSDFIVENVNALLHTSFAKPGFMLPIGLSFKTFQSISYTIDVYKGEVKAQKTFSKFLLFVSLYHQLVAGPIVRYAHVAKDIEERVFNRADFSEGINRFCRGLFKKVFIANTAGELAKQFLDANLADISVGGGWFGLIMFTLQIYFDFSGYSDMAIGLGKMFGFHYLENFNYPYIAKSITDFWRRWHISLSSFFRDYVYIPLGGNRQHQIVNIAIVWSLTGLWHGASWNFIIWGVYFGIIIILEKLFILKTLDRLPQFVKHTYALFLIVVGWAIFYYTDFAKLQLFASTLFGLKNNPLWDFQIQHVLLSNLFWLAFAILFCMPLYHAVKKLWVEKWKGETLWNYLQIGMNVIFLVISTAMLVANSYNPFLYFRF
jgi:alginate O-acetyltransferase complex protein AlgI